MSGPLSKVTVVELGGIGPAPFAGMVLADLGAVVVRVITTGEALTAHDGLSQTDILNRGKRSVAVDLKDPTGVEIVLGLAESSQIVIEGFRPGVTERPS